MSADPTTSTAPRQRTERRRPTGHRREPRVLAAIGCGGALGGLTRYEIGLAWPVGAGGFPWTTLAVNLTGALVAGVVVTLLVERWPPTRYLRPFAAVGVCGGYTTWSTFMTDTVLLGRDHRPALAVLYVAASLVGGLTATWTGVWLARRTIP